MVLRLVPPCKLSLLHLVADRISVSFFTLEKQFHVSWWDAFWSARLCQDAWIPCIIALCTRICFHCSNAVGCTVEGKKPMKLQEEIDEGTFEVPDS